MQWTETGHKQWQLQTERSVIVIWENVATGTKFLDCEQVGIDNFRLKNAVLEDAQKEAIDVVRMEIVKMLNDVFKIHNANI